ncbi:MAG: DUF2235 domain-containing protein [Methylococcaceae bacterium]
MAKAIVICSDGTWNKREKGSERNTNVAHFYDSLVENDDQQIKFYDPGIGTGLFKILGGATGYGISKNILDCYRFLIDTYRQGDKIYLFGFSRGAYTVRSLAGFIFRCGIIKPEHLNEVATAYQFYREQNQTAMALYKANKANPGNVFMIGVWDTVGALGIPVNWINQFNPLFHKFHDTKLNSSIKFAYHALAIDDDRKTFAPTLWDDSTLASDQLIEQIWYAGSHSDIGGGHPERDLPDVSLKWMLEKGKENGLQYREGSVDRLKPNPHGYLHNPRKGLGMVYRKATRAIPLDKKTKLKNSVKARTDSFNNQPIAKYRPPNLQHHKALPSHYTIVL